MALAVFDFPAPRFITYVGFIALGALAIIFLLQGMSELLHNARFSGIVYRL